MSIVDVETYVLLTKDSTTDESDVETMLDFAEAVIGEKLGRELASEERTERLVVFPGDVVYPRHTPVTEVDDEDHIIVDSVTVGEVTPDEDTWELWETSSDGLDYATVTYTGGWDADTLPRTIVLAICKTAQHLIQVGTPGNVQSATVGDVSVTFAKPTDVELPSGVWSSIKRYRARNYLPAGA